MSAERPDVTVTVISPKRKRGRPRKNLPLVPLGEKNTVAQKPDGRGRKPSRNVTWPTVDSTLVGQQVHGILDGCFDAGYLLTVHVGESQTVLRGAIFEPSLSVPISKSNDIAPFSSFIGTEQSDGIVPATRLLGTEQSYGIAYQSRPNRRIEKIRRPLRPLRPLLPYPVAPPFFLASVSALSNPGKTLIPLTGSILPTQFSCLPVLPESDFLQPGLPGDEDEVTDQGLKVVALSPILDQHRDTASVPVSNGLDADEVKKTTIRTV